MVYNKLHILHVEGYCDSTQSYVEKIRTPPSLSCHVHSIAPRLGPYRRTTQITRALQTILSLGSTPAFLPSACLHYPVIPPLSIEGGGGYGSGVEHSSVGATPRRKHEGGGGGGGLSGGSEAHNVAFGPRGSDTLARVTNEVDHNILACVHHQETPAFISVTIAVVPGRFGIGGRGRDR